MSIVAVAAGGLLPLAVFAGWLVNRNDVQEYVFANWTFNRHFIGCAAPFTLVKSVVKLFVFHPGICVLAAMALAPFPANRNRQEIIVVAVSTGVLTCLTFAPHVHYWLPLLPLLAILAAVAFVRSRGLQSWPAIGLLAAFVLLPGVIGAALVDPNRALLHGYSHPRLSDQLRRIDYVLALTTPEDLVYDGNVEFNVFRKDVDFIWFDITPVDSVLATYQSLRPRAFDVYEIIGRTRPKVVNAHLVSKDDPRIKSRYRVSEVFDRLLIRRDTAAP